MLEFCQIDESSKTWRFDVATHYMSTKKSVQTEITLVNIHSLRTLVPSQHTFRLYQTTRISVLYIGWQATTMQQPPVCASRRHNARFTCTTETQPLKHLPHPSIFWHKWYGRCVSDPFPVRLFPILNINESIHSFLSISTWPLPVFAQTEAQVYNNTPLL